MWTNDYLFCFTDNTSEVFSLTDNQANNLDQFTEMYYPQTGETKIVYCIIKTVKETEDV